MILGKNLIVALDGVAIAGAKSCKLNVSQSFLEVCSPTEARVMEKVPKTYDWSMSVDCLIPSSTLSVSLTDKLIKGTKCFITFTDGSGQNRAGFVYVKNCDESGNVGSLATFSASFESSGALYKYEIISPTTFYFSTAYGFRVINDAMTFNSDGSTLGADLEIWGGMKVLVFGKGPWAVVSLPLSDVEQYYAHGDYDYVGKAFVVGGKTDKLITLAGGDYAFLTSGNIANPSLAYILYQES